MSYFPATSLQALDSSGNVNNLTETSGSLNVNIVSGGSGGGTASTVSVSNLTGLATDSSLQQILSALQAQVQISDTVWTDSSGAFYIRRDTVNESNGTVTVTFTTPQGVAATPGAGLEPLSSTNNIVSTSYFTANAASTGYSVGDLLGRMIIASSARAPSTFTVVWLNLTTSSVLGTAPPYANVTPSTEVVSATQSGTWSVNVASSALPTGAALESGGNLAAINGKLPALSSGSIPVTLSAANITALTPPTSITVSNFPPTQPISGGVSVIAALPAGSNNIGSVTVGSSALPTGAAQETGGNLANIATNTSKIPSLGQAVAASSVPVVLPAAQITALTPLSTVAITAASLPLPTGAAQETGNLATIASNTGKIPSLGQAAAASSVPVVLTASQLATLTPPAAITGYALENGGNLASISSKLPASLGVKTSANSLSIVPASDATFNVSGISSSVTNRTITGTLTTSTTTLAINTGDLSGVGISITGTWAGTITFQGTIDGTNWFTIYGYQLPDSSYSYTTTANGQFFCCGAGLKQVQLSASLSSGTATVGMLATNNSPISTAQIRNTTLSATGTITATQASGAVWNVLLGTSTNTIGSVLDTPSPDVYSYQTITIAANASAVWTPCSYFALLGTARNVVIMPSITTAHSSSGATLQYKVQWLESQNSSLQQIFEYAEVLGTPASGYVSSTLNTKTWTIAAGTVQALPGICLTRKANYLCMWVLLSAVSTTQFVVQFDIGAQY